MKLMRTVLKYNGLTAKRLVFKSFYLRTHPMTSVLKPTTQEPRAGTVGLLVSLSFSHATASQVVVAAYLVPPIIGIQVELN